jgi:acyl-CoA thioester hydrolase
MKRDEFTMIHPLRVRWAEVDRQDVVFNANYFLYFDIAVTEYWRAIGLSYPKDYIERYGADLFAVKATADFHASARYDELVDVGCRVGRIGRSSVQFLLGIWRGDEHLTSGELIYVNTDVQTQRSKPWPESFTSAILAFERTAPNTHSGTAR